MEAIFLSPQEKAQTALEVDRLNKIIQKGKLPQQSLGKDDFLKILITQLSYQDPTAPMEDKEFVAQMAQFSSLEQMTSMASDFSKMAALLSGTEATGALGKGVELLDGEQQISGVVQAVTRGAAPEVLVNGSYYPWEQVTKIMDSEN
ncbi:MAG: flagellar hook assembly protein FlgD [Spirochaetaceae bacterium]|jgi:flagellar basal-body rod modification protein FlgD|nr:flagellar hook assembly protein FlgD [Spirochaetaceae bacterium]